MGVGKIKYFRSIKLCNFSILLRLVGQWFLWTFLIGDFVISFLNSVGGILSFSSRMIRLPLFQLFQNYSVGWESQKLIHLFTRYWSVFLIFLFFFTSDGEKVFLLSWMTDNFSGNTQNIFWFLSINQFIQLQKHFSFIIFNESLWRYSCEDYWLQCCCYFHMKDSLT